MADSKGNGKGRDTKSGPKKALAYFNAAKAEKKTEIPSDPIKVERFKLNPHPPTLVRSGSVVIVTAPDEELEDGRIHAEINYTRVGGATVVIADGDDPTDPYPFDGSSWLLTLTSGTYAFCALAIYDDNTVQQSCTSIVIP
jgi:hypothetical protein